MKIFHCDSCGSLVFFENVKCLKCGHTLGFLPWFGDLSALEPAENNTWKALRPGIDDPIYRSCSNGSQYQICNWMVPAAETNSFCRACELNDVIPNLEVPGNLQRWHKLENAKRRIVYTILQLGLPVNSVPEENRPALRFKFLGQTPGEKPVLSGHLDGVITVNIVEADDAEREKRRVNLHEPYRTLLGHFRHEVAHYYWDRLIANSSWLQRYRDLFGDETQDYGEALKKHYAQGAPADWQSWFVSAYASSHPWEDWAETWAHYMHIIDMVETASSFGIELKPKHPAAKIMTAAPEKAVKAQHNFDLLLEHWFPLTYALNSLNRGMGLNDIYPFALSAPVVEKLRFIDEVVQASGVKTSAESKK